MPPVRTLSPTRSTFDTLAAVTTLCALLALAGCGGDGGGGGGGGGGGDAASTPAADTSPAAPGASASASSCAGLPDASQMLAAINAVRASARSCGATAYPAAAPLAWNTQLAAAAQGHSDDMAAHDYFSHTSLDGRAFDQRAAAAGYAGGAMAENIAAGQATLQSTLNSWISSPGHCANLMNPAYKDVGLACASHSGSAFGTYWTWMAGAPR